MANNATSHIVRDVTALYPRLNQTYKYDPSAGDRGRTMPCKPDAEGAKFETSFTMTEDQAKELYGAMSEAYKARAAKEKNWPDKLPKASDVFKKDDNGMYVGKAVLKGSYGGEITSPPLQVDAKNKPLPDGFELTSGSRVNLSVVFVPYSMRDHGVSLRLKAVQVTKLEERKSYSPFDVEEGFSVEENTASPFEDLVSSADIQPEELPEETPEPKKVSKKAAAAPAPATDLGSILDEWD